MNIKHISCALQVKTLGVDGVFSGYASVFGKLDHQNEIVAAGAFARSLKQWQQQNRAPAMLWMHDPTQPIGLWQSVREDSTGLLVDGRLAPSMYRQAMCKPSGEKASVVTPPCRWVRRRGEELAAEGAAE